MHPALDLESALGSARASGHEPKQTVEHCDHILRQPDLDVQTCAEVHLMKGAALRKMGQLESAEAELQIALELATTVDDHRTIAKSYLHLGAIRLESHAFDEAREYLTIARHKFIHCCSLEGEAHVLFNLANLLLLEKQYGGARLALDDALLNYNEVGSIEGMSQVIATTALIHMLEGHYQQSIEKLQDCERLFLDLGDKKNALATALNRAECYIKLENLSYARVLLCSTRERARAHSFYVLETRALLVLSNLSQRLSEVTEASKHFYEARELAITHGFQPLFEALVRDMQLA
jgi:tetratricopeptide (TPR) repeat protein